MQPKKRYVQPQTVREAMETIQKLFKNYLILIVTHL